MNHVNKKRVLCSAAVSLVGIALVLSMLQRDPIEAEGDEDSTQSPHERTAARGGSRSGGIVPQVVSSGGSLGTRAFNGRGVSDSGFLTSTAKLELGLSDEEYQLAQSSISKLWWTLTERTSKKIFFDENLSKSMGENVEYFRIPALSDVEKTEIFGGFKSGLDGAIGEQRAKLLLDGVMDSNSFGGMGRFDCEIVLKPMTSVEIDPKTLELIADPVLVPGDSQVTFRYLYSDSGKLAVKSTRDLDGLNAMFGDLFVRK